MEHIDRDCIYCGKNFKARLPDVIKGRGKLCSRLCRNKWASETFVKTEEGWRERKKRKRKTVFKHKDNARALVQKAITSGKLTRQPCSVCGSEENIEAHHDDYDKPLEVRWLCSLHHKEHHKVHPE